jgi:hypothetical protein
MPSASFFVISSLRVAAINSYLSLWLLYHFMTGEALTRIFHELLSRDHEDGRATGQPQGVGFEA